MTDMETKIHNVIRNNKVAEGANRLMLSVILSISTTPKTALATFPFLAALGHVTDRLASMCKWSPQVTQKVKELGKIKNKKLGKSGLLTAYFQKVPDFLPSVGQEEEMEKVTKFLSRYYRMMMTEMLEIQVPEQYWVNEVTKTERKLSRQFFNKPDSDIAIITSELLDLGSSPKANTDISFLDEDQMTEPSAQMSQVESLKDLEYFLEFSEEQQEQFLQQSLSADSTTWSDMELAFFDQTAPKSHLFRINTDCCLFFDVELNAFCQNPAVDQSSRCQVHQDTENTKFMQILATIGNQQRTKGFSLCMSAFRYFIEPKSSQKIYEFAPCLEGALPAFKYSENNLRKILTAGFQSFKAGYNSSSSKPFKDNFFREQFPNQKAITSQQWMHAYLSIRVSRIIN